MTKPLGSTDLKRLHRDWRRRTAWPLALILDSVQTPVNVGAIARTAAAYRVDHVWLSGATPAPNASGARKTALGTDRYLVWSNTPNAVDAIAEARAGGYRVVGVELAEAAQPLFDVALNGATCLVVGHEDRGLAASTLDACDAVAYLPLVGRVGSLNVAAATAIALYEVRRQEWSSK